MLKLEILSGSLSGKRFGLTSANVILGRDESSCQIVLNDRSISSKHAVISRDEKNIWHIQDLGSTNGTYINNQKIVRKQEFASEVGEIRIGDITIKYTLEKSKPKKTTDHIIDLKKQYQTPDTILENFHSSNISPKEEGITSKNTHVRKVNDKILLSDLSKNHETSNKNHDAQQNEKNNRYNFATKYDDISSISAVQSLVDNESETRLEARDFFYKEKYEDLLEKNSTLSKSYKESLLIIEKLKERIKLNEESEKKPAVISTTRLKVFTTEFEKYLKKFSQNIEQIAQKAEQENLENFKEAIFETSISLAELHALTTDIKKMLD